MKFGTRAFYGRALQVGLPVMAQMLIQNLVSLIDNFMVSNLGDVKMSGVNIAGQINFLFIVLLFNVVCPGAGIFMSQFKGAKDDEGMRQVFRLKLVVCIAAASLWTVLCLTNSAPLLRLMVKGNVVAGDIVSSAVSYQKVLAWAWLPVAISGAVSSSLRETGRVKAPLVISVAATVVNTVGNYALIYGHFGAPRLEVAGAAIATVAARVVEAAAFLVFIKVTKPEFRTRLRGIFRINPRLSRGVLSKAAMVGVSELSWAVTETISMAVFNGRGGAEVVSGMASGFTICNLFFVSFAGIFTATGVLLGTTLGRGDLDEARRVKTAIISGCAVFGVIFALLGASSSLLIPIVFPGLSEAARLVSRGLVLVGAAYMPLWCVLNSQVAVSRAGGDTAMGAIMDMTANAILLVMIFPLAIFTALGPVAIYAIIKLTDVYKTAFATLWLRRNLWLHNMAAESSPLRPVNDSLAQTQDNAADTKQRQGLASSQVGALAVSEFGAEAVSEFGALAASKCRIEPFAPLENPQSLKKAGERGECQMKEEGHPQVTVVIPTYNRARLVLRAVKSVLAQSEWQRGGMECIVVDDGSTDNTEEAVRGIIAEANVINAAGGGHPAGSRVIYAKLEQNSGACAARNRGIELARGQYIAFLDSDDVWHTDYVSRQMQFLTASGADVVICRMQCMDENGGVMHLFPNDSVTGGGENATACAEGTLGHDEPSVELTYQSLLRYNAASTQVMFGKAQCFLDVRFDEDMPRMQDWDEVLRLVQRYKVCYQSSVLVDTYLQGDSITRHSERAVAAMEKIFKKHSEAILADNIAAVSFYRKMASFVKQSGGNPAEEYKQAARHGGGAKDIVRAIVWSLRPSSTR